jgi:ketosteroid isomerase-like protein
MLTPTHHRFRIAAILVAVALLAVSAARAQQAPDQLHTASRQELDIVKVLLAQQEAWNAGNLAAYASAYKDSPDTLFVGRQILRGYTPLLEDYRHNYPTKESMGTLNYTGLEVHSLSDTLALCVGGYHLDRSKKAGGSAEGLFSLILEKTSQGWKIVFDHTN